MRDGLKPKHGLKAHLLSGDAIVISYDLGQPAHVSYPLLEELPEAQRRVALLALEGRSDREIAQALGRSRHTISNQLRCVYRALGVASRTELAALACQRCVQSDPEA